MISWWRHRPLYVRDGVPGVAALVGGLVAVLAVDASRAVWPLGVAVALGAATAITVGLGNSVRAQRLVAEQLAGR